MNSTVQKEISLNIKKGNENGICDKKCEFSFHYPVVNLLQITHLKDNISVTADMDISTNPTPVTYNNKLYSVTKAIIYAPSLHLYENSNADAELMIEHTPIAGGNQLRVFIPLTISSNSSKASSILSGIVTGTSNKAPRENDKCSLTVNDFTFGDFIPQGPFYSYTGHYGASITDFIVYGKSYSISIIESELINLKKMITKSAVTVLGAGFYLNSKGVSKFNNNQSEGIYINCKPTGKSTETTDVVTAIKPDWGDIWTPSSAQLGFIGILVGIFLIVVLILYGIYVFIGWVSPTKLKPTFAPAAIEAGFFQTIKSMFSFS